MHVATGHLWEPHPACPGGESRLPGEAILTLNLMDSSRWRKQRPEGEGATLGGFGKEMEPGLDWWGALQCFLGPLFSILSALPAEVSPLLFLPAVSLWGLGGIFQRPRREESQGKVLLSLASRA